MPLLQNRASFPARREIFSPPDVPFMVSLPPGRRHDVYQPQLAPFSPRRVRWAVLLLYNEPA